MLPPSTSITMTSCICERTEFLLPSTASIDSLFDIVLSDLCVVRGCVIFAPRGIRNSSGPTFCRCEISRQHSNCFGHRAYMLASATEVWRRSAWHHVASQTGPSNFHQRVRTWLVAVASRNGAAHWRKLESSVYCVRGQHVPLSLSLSQLEGRSSTRSRRMWTALSKNLGRVNTRREVNRNWKSEGRPAGRGEWLVADGIVRVDARQGWRRRTLCSR